ncbi:hypothetical protein ACFO0O_12320 [Cobetia amphilecti]|uniref:Uncharacterized protein n=1 Tax=Cobetia amphilecti TaxID=1055104 RepID=A0ABT6UKH4_9GAMM|nr:hypothetical protein [Cobetia amphilecti]MDI5883216.1 hypothetical protein [Cobetia amphilecti]
MWGSYPVMRAFRETFRGASSGAIDAAAGGCTPDHDLMSNDIPFGNPKHEKHELLLFIVAEYS